MRPTSRNERFQFAHIFSLCFILFIGGPVSAGEDKPPESTWQDFKNHVVSLTFTGILAGVVGYFLYRAQKSEEKIEEDKQRKRDRARERLEKLYAPLHAHLIVNDRLWEDFKREIQTDGLLTEVAPLVWTGSVRS